MPSYKNCTHGKNELGMEACGKMIGRSYIIAYRKCLNGEIPEYYVCDKCNRYFVPLKVMTAYAKELERRKNAKKNNKN